MPLSYNKRSAAKQYYHSTSELLVDDAMLLATMVMTTVSLMRGTATESKLLPVTVTFVPPLKCIKMFVNRQNTFRFSNFDLYALI